jgi:hypothetical protein
MNYDLKEHKHRYAIWTAARAVQRSFTTTSNISFVINNTSLRDFAQNVNKLDQTKFDQLHMEWCQAIIKGFDNLNIPASYGRAAKIVAIYLKTSLIISSDLESNYHKFIHPPIDRILLTNLPNEDPLKEIRTIRWTTLDQNDYWDMVKKLREYYNYFDWRLEILWKPELEII